MKTIMPLQDNMAFEPMPMLQIIRVACYIRVSTDDPAQEDSYEAQEKYFSRLLYSRPDWDSVGVYSDYGISGTNKDNRTGLNRLLRHCEQGRIDRVICKSISRLSRNTADTVAIIRRLQELGITCYFEKESLDTGDMKSEFILTTLAALAQEESRTISENLRWSFDGRAPKGDLPNYEVYGYRLSDEIEVTDTGYRRRKVEIIPEEAEIVRSIFDDYLAGRGVTAIAKRLNESGYATQSGCVFHKSAVERILRNYAYTGNLLLQTKFRENHLTKVTRKNQGELPRYHATDTHEAIIPLETFNAVQAEIRRRKEKYAPAKPQQPSPFTGLITCAICGKHYRRKTTATGPVWICSTYNSYGKSYCPSKAIPEEKLMQTAALVGHAGEITGITAHNDNLLEFTLKDGTNAVKRWQDRSRAESWTAEMRRAAGEKTRERKQHHAES